MGCPSLKTKVEKRLYAKKSCFMTVVGVFRELPRMELMSYGKGERQKYVGLALRLLSLLETCIIYS